MICGKVPCPQLSNPVKPGYPYRFIKEMAARLLGNSLGGHMDAISDREFHRLVHGFSTSFVKTGAKPI
jgi:hypothetical protein